MSVVWVRFGLLYDPQYFIVKYFQFGQISIICVAINFNIIEKVRVDKCKLQCFQQFIVDFGAYFIKNTTKLNNLFINKIYMLLLSPFLYTGMTFANFKESGTTPVTKERLQI